MVIVIGGYTYASPFVEAGYDTKSINPRLPVPEDLPNDTELVVFCGGTDVNPRLYGEEPDPRTGLPDVLRDLNEGCYYKQCVNKNIPMLGICRGSQFLTVMNGGKLVQHINNHGMSGTHPLFQLTKILDEDVEITSTHHQMMFPYKSENDFEVLATAAGKENTTVIEVVWWPDTKCLCIQGHPEYMPRDSSGYKYFRKLLEKYLDVVI